MTRQLPNFANNLAQNIKCKCGHNDRKCET